MATVNQIDGDALATANVRAAANARTSVQNRELGRERSGPRAVPPLACPRPARERRISRSERRRVRTRLRCRSERALGGSDEHPQRYEPVPEFRGGRSPAGVPRGLATEPPPPIVGIEGTRRLDISTRRRVADYRACRPTDVRAIGAHCALFCAYRRTRRRHSSLTHRRTWTIDALGGRKRSRSREACVVADRE